MKILIVSATRFEVEPLIGAMAVLRNAESNFISGAFNGIEIDFLITGVGMVATAYFTGKVLDESYDLAINAGICGSFNKNLEIGDVVNISEDAFSELGAEDDVSFLSLEDMQLPGITKLINRSGALSEVLERLPKVNGITVNTTHGNESSIQKVYDRMHPYVESMEGAAFMFACEQERIPYVQLRAVSNYVEKRNRDAWNIPLAIKNLNEKLVEFISSI
ncbi:MAG: mqnB [Bacteroidota bacterium]|jgi:futalosine hydrolase|nr:mqnB [Bacteroidota bacterium]